MKLFDPSIFEAFDNMKAAKGSVNFSQTQLTDPHIVQVMRRIAQATGTSVANIQKTIEDNIAKFQPMATSAPILYGTIVKNIVEDQVFTTFNDINKKTRLDNKAPEFNSVVFGKLVKRIRGEHPDFWPLRGFVDRRPLWSPVFELLDDPNDPSSVKSTGDPKNPSMADRIQTAAATPSGKFYFSVPFMQSLLDYAHIKGIKPKQKKYACNGGPFPDEYAYIDFLIMHELMHYSNDDFYYQKIIPNSDPKIINWVGDFRTNYLLVKSGYEQLPMGLFNDDINYDRQATYRQMYDLVKSEFDKLNEQQKEEIEDQLDSQSDDHSMGQDEGAKSDPSKTDNVQPGQIDDKGKKIKTELEGDVVNDGKEAPTEPSSPSKPQSSNTPGSQSGQGGTIDKDYKPAFNWKQLLSKFIKSSQIGKNEETWSRQHRRGVTGMDIMVQRGAAAMKPGEKPSDTVELKLAFVLDVSGSMSAALKAVYANAKALLQQPQFAKAEVYVLKFSDTVKMYKGIFATNKACAITSVAAVVNDKKRVPYDITMASLFDTADLGGTVFSSVDKTDLNALLSNGYNVLLITDTDILYGTNLTLTKSLIDSHPRQMFLMLATKTDYERWRAQVPGNNANITYLLD